MYSRSSAHLLLLVGFALAALTGCDRDNAAKPAECVPSCEGRCEGDNGCGGECACEPDAHSCGDRCAPHESCVAGQCVCTPQCNKQACVPDGCGGSCPCADDLVQNAHGEWVSPDQCMDECGTAGWVCGALCGQTCGGCGSAASCELGQCVADFCTREACNETVSCEGCSLTLRELSKRIVAGRLLEVTLALDYAPQKGEPLPRIGDFRIDSNQDVQLMSVERGAALEAADKDFFIDPVTKAPFRRRSDGSFQLMALNLANTNEIQAGRIATLRFAVGSEKPVAFRFVRRVETLAPPLADSALQATKYDQGLLVKP